MQKPSKVDVFFKLRSQPMFALRLGTSFNNPSVDSDLILPGIQNQSEFEVPFDPLDEKYDIFYRGLNESGEGQVIRINRTLFKAQLNQVGGLNTTNLNFVIADPLVPNVFKADDVLEIDNELMVVSSYNDVTKVVTVEERGAHGTTASSHPDLSNVFLMRYTVPHNSIILSGDIRELGPGTLQSIVPILDGFLLIVAGPTDPDGILDAFVIFRNNVANATTQTDVISVRPKQTSYIIPIFLKSTDPVTNTWFIRIKSVTRSNVFSSVFSNELSAKVLLTDVLSEAGKPNPINIDVIGVGGGLADLDFLFLVGTEILDNINVGGITQTQLQVALPNVAWSATTGFATTVIDDIIGRKPPFATTLRVPLSSADVGGAYQFSARIFNAHANIWSDWNDPNTALGAKAFTVEGNPDSGLPIEPRSFILKDVFLSAGDARGNSIEFEILEPAINSRGIWQYEIQGVKDSFNVTNTTLGFEDNTGLLGIQTTGTGTISVGGSVLNVVSGGIGTFTANQFAGKILYIHSGMPVDVGGNLTGEITFPQAFNIAGNTVVGGNISTITINQPGKTFRLKGDPGSGTTTVTWIISNSWQDDSTLVVRPFRISSLITRGSADNERFKGELFSQPSRFWRVRAWNFDGAGKWLFWDNIKGTTVASSAIIFATSNLQTAALADLSVTTTKLANLAVTGGKIVDLAITTTKIADNSISTPKLQANSVLANNIFVNDLSAISANLGTITAGTITGTTITGGTFQTATTGRAIRINTINSIDFTNTASQIVGSLDVDVSGNMGLSATGILTLSGNSFVQLNSSGVLGMDIISSGHLGLSSGAQGILLESITVSVDIQPKNDNLYAIGTTLKRYADVRSVLINGADICLENDWRFREYPASKFDIGKSKEWMKKNANLGIQILDDEENLIAVIHKDGNLYVKGEVRSLNELCL